MFDNNMLRIWLVIASMAPLPILQGCSKTIEGEAFLVNPKGASEKLSLVKVYQFDDKQIEALKSEIETNGKKIAGDLKTAIEKVDEKKLDAALAAMKSVEDLGQSIVRRCVAVKGHMAMCFDVVRKVASVTVESTDALKKEIVDIGASINDLEKIPNTAKSFVAQAIENAANRNNALPIKTNSEGKYSIKLTSNQNKLFAVPESTQLKATSIWLIDASKSGEKIMLSNDNLYGTNCKECVPMELSKDTQDNIEKTASIVHCFNDLKGSERYGCDSKKFVDNIKKLKGV